MKSEVLFVLMLTMQSSASFLDSIQEVFAPMERSFESIVTDVVSNIRDTVDCTILAVEQVFSFGGEFGDSTSMYDRKCRGQSEPAPLPAENARYQDITLSETQTQSEVESSAQDLSEHISESISSSTQTVNQIMDASAKEASTHIQNVEDVLRNKSDNDGQRIADISSILDKDINNVSVTIKNKIEMINCTLNNKATVEKVVNEIKVLYEVEQNDKKSPDSDDIKKVFDDVSGVKHINNTIAIPNDDGVKEIIVGVQNSYNDTYINIDDEIQKWKHAESVPINNDTKEDKVFPKTFRDIAKRIFSERTILVPTVIQTTHKSVPLTKAATTTLKSVTPITATPATVTPTTTTTTQTKVLPTKHAAITLTTTQKTIQSTTESMQKSIVSTQAGLTTTSTTQNPILSITANKMPIASTKAELATTTTTIQKPLPTKAAETFSTTSTQNPKQSPKSETVATTTMTQKMELSTTTTSTITTETPMTTEASAMIDQLNDFFGLKNDSQEPFDLSLLFQSPKSQNEATQEAEELIKESERSRKIIDNFFNNIDQSDSGGFNFGNS